MSNQEITNEVLKGIQIKEILDTHILDILSEYTSFESTGKDSHGDCPFCKKPKSLTVSQSKAMWYCFGCSRGGDTKAFIHSLPHTRNVAEIVNEYVKKYDGNKCN